MTTKNLIPRASGEGGIGITNVTWGYGYYDTGNFNKGLFVKGSGIEDVIANTVTQGGLGGEWTRNGLDIYYNGGNVGIGTTDPGDSLLNVSPTAGTDPSSFKVFQNSTAGPAIGRNGGVVLIDANYYQDSSDIFSVNGRGVNKLTIKGNGNVGIGLTNPGRLLHLSYESALVYDSAQMNRVDVNIYSRNTNGTNGCYSGIDFVAGVSSAIIAGVKTSTGASALTFGTTIAGQDDTTEKMRIDSAGNVGIGVTNPSSTLTVSRLDQNEINAALSVYRSDTSPGNRPTAPIFNVFNGTGGSSEVFRVQGDGNVYIKANHAITDPESVGLGHSVHILNTNTADINTGSSLYLGSNSNSGAGIYAQRTSITTDEHKFGIGTRDSLDNWSTKVTVLGNGKVGIGTKDPNEKLEVRGNLRFGGTAYGSVREVSIGNLTPTGFYDLTLHNAFQGFLIISITSNANAGIRTYATYSVFGRGLNDFNTTPIAVVDTGGGVAFSLSKPSVGVIRFTNTSSPPITCQSTMVFYGSTSA